MIPISLYVVIEVLKLGQAILINKDLKMYFGEDGNFALCRNSDLIEEMGQVEFVFSDKTGTLTQNKMEFKKVTVNGRVYGERTNEEDPVMQEGMCYSSVERIKEALAVVNNERRPYMTPDDDESSLHEFFNLLAVCHTVVCDVDPKTSLLTY
jgi:magnesium-transporting ATPase (P-type)